MTLVQQSTDLDVWRSVADAAPHRRVELVNGEVVVVNAPLPRHQLLLGRIFVRLLADATDADEVVLGVLCTHNDGQDHRVVPDLAIFPKAGFNPNNPELPLSSATLVAEVLSKSTAHLDRGSKWALYASAGVQTYLLGDTADDTVIEYRLTNGQWDDGRPFLLN